MTTRSDNRKLKKLNANVIDVVTSALICVLLVILLCQAHHTFRDLIRKRTTTMPSLSRASYKKWLMNSRQERVTVRQADAAGPFDDKEFAAEWTKLKHELQPGDELWAFNLWDDFAHGFLIVRDGVCVSDCFRFIPVEESELEAAQLNVEIILVKLALCMLHLCLLVDKILQHGPSSADPQSSAGCDGRPVFSGSQAPAREPTPTKLCSASREVELPESAFPNWSLGTRG